MENFHLWAIFWMTLERAGQSLLDGLALNGRSQNYVDRLDKLFNTLPAKVKSARLSKMPLEALAEAVVDPTRGPGNIRTLRAFIGQIYATAQDHYGPLGLVADKMNLHFNQRWERVMTVRFPELIVQEQSFYAPVFERLEAEEEKWAQALCIRLYFEFRAPLSRLMAARWDQIEGDVWYPYTRQEKVYWYWSSEPISPPQRELLDRVQQHITVAYGQSNYIFPTIGAARPITSVERLWKRVLIELGWKPYPLRELALSKRLLSNPSYYITTIQSLGGVEPNWMNKA